MYDWTVKQSAELREIRDAITVMYRHCNVTDINPKDPIQYLPLNWSYVLFRKYSRLWILDFLYKELEYYFYRTCIEMFLNVMKMHWNALDCIVYAILKMIELLYSIYRVLSELYLSLEGAS